jgi:CheY-like chemotaxis protein
MGSATRQIRQNPLFAQHGTRSSCDCAQAGRTPIHGRTTLELNNGEECIEVGVQDTGAADPEPYMPLSEGRGRLLVVDDNSDAAETLSELLRIDGYEVQHVGHGEAALELLDRYVPDLALLDIGLPGIDGYQLAGMLRADPRAAGMKLVALTGYGQDNDRALALAAGFDEHLVKPVMVDRLLEVMQLLLRP